MACEMHAVRLVVEGRELVQDWQLIRQCGIEGNTTVTATVNRLERVLDVREEEQQLPGVLMSRQREVPTLPSPPIGKLKKTRACRRPASTLSKHNYSMDKLHCDIEEKNENHGR